MDVVIFTCVSGIFFQRSIGAYQIANFLRQNGYTVQIIDFTDYFTSEELLTVSEKFITDQTLAVGISTTFYQESNDDKSKFLHNGKNKFELNEFPENVLTTIANIKLKFPEIKIVAGGAKAESTRNIKYVDTIIHGYAEDKFLQYLNTLPNNKNRVSKNVVFEITTEHQHPKVIHTEPLVKNFSIEQLSHNFSNRDCVLPNETLPLEVSRGCIFKCLFCAFPLNGKSKLDYLRDPVLIKEELIHNYESYGTTNYFLSDDTFNDSTEKIERLHRVITDLPFKINFATYLRLDLLHAHKEQISLLQEMGLASPFFGIESLNQSSASIIGKGMNTTRTKDFLLELYHTHWKEQIPITASFIIGLPKETKETILETYNWIKSSPINSVFFPLSITEKSFYKSEFDVNYSKYGYQFDPATGYWKNDSFDFTEASDLAETFNEELMRKENYPSSWFLMTLLSHGYSLNEATTTRIKDLNYIKIFKQKQKNIRDYKKKLLGIE